MAYRNTDNMRKMDSDVKKSELQNSRNVRRTRSNEKQRSLPSIDNVRKSYEGNASDRTQKQLVVRKMHNDR